MMIMKHCDIFDHQNVLQRRNIQLEYGLDQGNPPTSAELQINLQKVKSESCHDLVKRDFLLLEVRAALLLKWRRSDKRFSLVNTRTID